MMPGYKVPTNLELVAEADTIVLGTITGEREAAMPHHGTVIVRPDLLIKGGALPAQVEIRGAYLQKGTFGYAVASLPRELRKPNPGALIGGCVRYVFTPDSQLLLFLKRDRDGELVPIRHAFSRDAEDVRGHDALWVKAVREYAAIGAFTEAQREQAMRSRVVALRARPEDADAAAIADDLEVELAGRRQPNHD